MFIKDFRNFMMDNDGQGGGGGTPTASGAPAAAPVEGASASAAPAVPQPATGSGQQPAKPVTPEEILDWRKDERYGRMWNQKGMEFNEDQHKLINDGFYKSYRNIEKVYEPAKQELATLKTQMDEINAIAKEIGVEPSQLKEILGEYKTFKDPENLQIKRGNYFGGWYDNPLYQPEMIKFFNDLEQKELQRRYPNMNTEQIQKQVEIEKEIGDLKAKNKAIEEEKMLGTFKKEIDDNIAKVKKYSESRGFAYTDEIHDKLMKHCHENQIPTKYIFQTFLELHGEGLDTAYAEKIKQGQLQDLNKNKDGTVIPSVPGTPAAPASGTFREKLKKAVTGMGYN